MNEREPAPPGIYPGLRYADAASMIDWLCRAFGFQRRLVVPGEDGGVRHSELSFGDAVLMVGSPRPAEGDRPPLPDSRSHVLSLYVEDPDAHHARAVAEGARILEPVADTPFGARGYMAADPEGHVWFFANYRPGAYWEEGALVARPREGVCRAARPDHS